MCTFYSSVILDINSQKTTTYKLYLSDETKDVCLVQKTNPKGFCLISSRTVTVFYLNCQKKKYIYIYIFIYLYIYINPVVFIYIYIYIYKPCGLFRILTNQELSPSYFVELQDGVIYF